MARKLSDPKGEGRPAPKDHNSGPLNDEEEAALYAYFSLKIRAQQKKAAAKKAEYDAEREEVTALFAKVKGELRVKRKDFEELLAAQEKSETEFRADEAKRLRRFLMGGLPVGTQLAFDLGPTSTADEQQLARSDGKRAGLRGADPVPPDYVAPIMHPTWMEGWHEGQTEIAMQMGKAESILAARAAPAADPEEGAEAEPEEEFDPDASARKLKKNGFTKRSAETQAEAA